MSGGITLSAKLDRTDSSTPWGFRMQGGKDFSASLTIQRVTPGSLAANCGLQAGDVILRINHHNCNTMKHKDAQDAIIKAGHHLELTLQRGGPLTKPQAPGQFGQTYAPNYGRDVDNIAHQTQQMNISHSARFDDTRPGQEPHYAGYQDHNLQGKSFTSLKDTISRGQDPSAVHNPPWQRDTVNEAEGVKKYVPSETFKLVHEEAAVKNKADGEPVIHSKSFKILQDQLDRDTPAAPPPPAPQGPKPFYLGGRAPAAQPPWQQSRSPAAPPAPPPPPPASVPKAPPAPAAPSKWSPAKAPSAAAVGPRPFPGTTSSGNPHIRGRAGDVVISKPVVGPGMKIPVCGSCGSPIRGPFVIALGKNWCPDHFVCANPQCGTKLEDKGFIEVDGKLYCESDYAKYFAPNCGKCHKPVVGDCIHALDKDWHPDCFTCVQCHRVIGAGAFHVENGQFYCEQDWGVMFQTKCFSCEFPIEPGDRWVEALNQNWHAECFNCSTCQMNLEGQGFVAKNGRPYCKRHGAGGF